MIKKLLTATFLAAVAMSANAASTDPLDFDYEVDAATADRPALIFNDGSNTFVQARPGQQVAAAGSYTEGAYVVFAGVPGQIQFNVNSHPVTATWRKSNQMLSEPGNPNSELARDFSGFLGHIAIIGSYGTLEAVRPTDMSLPLAGAIKTLTPSGWSGSAEKSVNATRVVALRTEPGVNWLQALDQLLTRENLYAEADFGRRHISLRGEPEKASAVVEPSRVSVSSAVATLESGASADKNVSAGIVSTVGEKAASLASVFGVISVKDEGTDRISMCFHERPLNLNVLEENGSMLSTKWDNRVNCLTFNRMARFTVKGTQGAIDVARVAGADYEFPSDNVAGLQRVYEDETSTYLVFVNTPHSLHVIDDLGMDNGVLRDRYYKYEGKPAKLSVVADGHAVTVLRNPSVHFFQKPRA